jgi:heme A synthase
MNYKKESSMRILHLFGALVLLLLSVQLADAQPVKIDQAEPLVVDGGLVPEVESDHGEDLIHQDNGGTLILIMPSGVEWGIGFFVLVIGLFVFYLLYRAQVEVVVKKGKHPAGLRSGLFLLAAVFILIWGCGYFVVFLSAFRWLAAVGFLILALPLIIASYRAKK